MQRELERGMSSSSSSLHSSMALMDLLPYSYFSSANLSWFMDCPRVVISPSKPCLIWYSSCGLYCSMFALACAINSRYIVLNISHHYLPPSHIMWFWLILIIAVLAALAYLYGVFTPVTIYKDKLVSPHLLHFTFRGKKELIGEQFDRITKDIGDHFKLATFFGIYYSFPSEPVWDCVVGFQVNEGQSRKVEEWKEAHPQYTQTKLKSTRYVGAMLPFINHLSFLINVPKISEFYRLVKEDKIEPYKGLIERYHFLPLFGKKVELMNPIDNCDQWDLLE